MGLKPRVLADDLQLMAVGEGHSGSFKNGFDKTHLHLERMGARLAPQKSITFSTDGTSRNWLVQHEWRRVGRTISVLTNCRDLGAHRKFAKNAKYGTTLSERMRKAAAYARRVGRMRAPYRTKLALGLAKITPMALYGCETCPIN